jgi:hypothetical protein
MFSAEQAPSKPPRGARSEPRGVLRAASAGPAGGEGVRIRRQEPEQKRAKKMTCEEISNVDDGFVLAALLLGL